MFQPPGPANATLKLKTPSGSQMGSFSDPQPIPLRSAGRPKVLVLICTQPWLLAFVTVTCAWAPTANSNAQQRIDSQILNFFIGKLPPLENLATGEQFGCQRGGNSKLSTYSTCGWTDATTPTTKGQRIAQTDHVSYRPKVVDVRVPRPPCSVCSLEEGRE